MKIDELRKRESFDVILKDTLDRIVRPGGGEMQQWYEHPYFSVFVTRGFCNEGISFLQSQYSYTPHRFRRAVQSACVGILGLRGVFEHMLKPAFELSEMEHAHHIMWMPGNQRLRRFDFANRLISVFCKSGFSGDGVRREIHFRERNSDKFEWVLPVIHADCDSFTEALLDACPLDRESDKKRRCTGLKKATRALESLHRIDRSEMKTSEYLRMKHSEFVLAKERIHSKFPGLALDGVEKLWERASNAIGHSDIIEVSQTHGDFQPGNVLLSLTDDQFWLIDWEDTAVRACVYDGMTWGLRSRFPEQIHKRIAAFLSSPNPDGFEGIHLHCPTELALALWLIEEWIWLMDSGARLGISDINVGLRAHFRELGKILKMPELHL